MADTFNIYHAPYTKEQIDLQIENSVPQINSDTGNWQVWDIDSNSWVDTEVKADATTIRKVEYGVSNSPLTQPTTWTESIPSILGGEFLWTRYTWSHGEVTYTVAKQGASGSGGGDMLKSDYDSNGVVRGAGGIPGYAVSFAQAQQLTDSAKQTARNNIGATTEAYVNGKISNPNLLDNPWFTVNQRGQTTYSGAVYSLDRFTAQTNDSMVSINEDGTVTFFKAPDAYIQLCEKVFFDNLKGKTLTASVMYADGSIDSGTATIPLTNDSFVAHIIDNNILNFSVADFPSAPSHQPLRLVIKADSVSIRALKLELGTVSTLANDTVPNYAEELAKCQRYFLRLKGNVNATIGMCVNGYTTIFTPVTMNIAKTPTVALTGGIFGWNGTQYDATSVSLNNVSTNGIKIILNGVSITGACNLKADSYLDISCDL